MRVAHPVFGEGIVLESQMANDDEEVIIEFEDLGTKRLAASLAKLTLLDA
jgi:DNA helicase-2/ATP-dependent DNA helicase PcrA